MYLFFRKIRKCKFFAPFYARQSQLFKGVRRKPSFNANLLIEESILHFSHRVLTDTDTKHLHLQIRIFLLFLQNKNVMMVSLLYSSIEMKGREKKSTFQKVLNKNHFPRTYGSPRILLGLHTLNGGDDGLFQKALLWSKNTMIQI